MNLRAKKLLAAKTFNIGKERIIFVNERIEEIKEAITKQDMRNLLQDGAIRIREVGGRKIVIKNKRKRTKGKIRKRVNQRKRNYIILTRKLRKFIKEKRKNGEIGNKEEKELRKKIRNKMFKSKSHLKENIGGLKNENTKKKKKRK